MNLLFSVRSYYYENNDMDLIIRAAAVKEIMQMDDEKIQVIPDCDHTFTIIVDSDDNVIAYKNDEETSVNEKLKNVVTSMKYLVMHANKGKSMPLNEEISYPIYGIKFKNSIGIAVGKKSVYSIDTDEIIEKDEGYLWKYKLKSDVTSFQNTYLDVCFASPDVAFAVGENGIMNKFIFN